MELCKSISYGLEKQSTQPSITVRGERLDFRNLLARASAGILDLNMFSLPRTSDLDGSSVDDQKIEDLMNRPDTVLDRCFGCSVEEAEAEMKRHTSVIRQQQQQQQQQQQLQQQQQAAE